MNQDFRLPIVDPVAGGYASRAESVVWGANWSASRNLDLYLTYSDAIASRASGTDYENLVVGATYRPSERDSVTGELLFGSYDDLADRSLGYDADLYRIEWRRGF
jgi:hypothetical protein